ncbi:MAG: hypothetical protein DSY83_11150, partial [Flavobacteriia bacterium]
NYNFEVGILNGANIAPSAINGDKIQNGTVGSQDLAPRSVGLSHLQDGGANGDLFQWNGSAWTLINQADISITEVDGIIGNEVVDATDGTLTRTGNGIDIPYTLGVSPLGIGTNELADDSVTNEKINANVAGNGLNQAADGSLEVVVSDLVGDGSLSSPASTIALTGTPSGSLLENVGIDVADNAITSAKIFDGTIATIDIADNAINSAKIVDGTIVAADLTDGAVTSAKILDATIATIDIADNAINSSKIVDGTIVAADLADASVTLPKIADGTTTGQLMQWNGTDWILVEESSLNITEVDGIIGNEVTGATDATLELNGTGVVGDPYTLDVATGGIGTNEIADASVTLPKIADGTTAGQLMQWDGTDWILVEESSLNITEDDGIVGNEVVDATVGGSLVRLGGGTDIDPYTLDVNDGGIGTLELANAAVTTDKIADADVTPAKIEPSSSLTDGQVLTTIGGNTVWRSPYHAIGKVINSTPTANILGANIIPLNTGNYRVVFSTNANSADYIIQLSVLNAAASGYVIEVVTQDVDNFTVQITNLSGAAVDATWFFTVTDF